MACKIVCEFSGTWDLFLLLEFMSFINHKDEGLPLYSIIFLKCKSLLQYYQISCFQKFVKVVKVLVTPLFVTLFDPMGSIPPGSSVCGIFWARILEQVAI